MSSIARRSQIACAALFSLLAAANSVLVADEATKELGPATHKQVRTIIPMVNGQSLSLNTYCLKPDFQFLIFCFLLNLHILKGLYLRVPIL